MTSLGILIDVAPSKASLRVGGLPTPIRLLRQLRQAGATGPAILICSTGNELEIWRRWARREGAAAISRSALPDVARSERVNAWVLARGTFVFSGEGLADTLRRATPDTIVTLSNDTTPALSVVRPDAEHLRAGPLTSTAPDTRRRALPEQSFAGYATDTAAASRLHGSLMERLGRPQDPNFSRLFGRRLSGWISGILAPLGVAPNTVTMAAVTTGLLGAAMVWHGGPPWTIAGVIALIVSRILDDCDGEVARMTVRETTFGARFDIVGDLVVYVAVFAALALNLHSSEPEGEFLWALVLVLAGGALTTLLVLGFVTGTDLPERSRTLRLLERTASGDFVYPLLAFALIERLDWFLWASAIGAQCYWVVLGGIVLATRRASRVDKADGARSLLNYFEVTLFCAGTGLLVFLVREVGGDGLSHDIAMIGWGFVLVCAQELLAIAANTVAWRRSIAPASRLVGFVRLFALRLAGDGVNHLTPSATIGGEFVRARLLAVQLGAPQATASVTLAKFAETAGQFVFVALGLAVLLPFLEQLGGYRWGMLALVLGAGLGVVALARMLERGFFGFAARRLSSVGIARSWFRRHADDIAGADALVQECMHERPGDLLASVAWYAVGFATSVVEVWLILHLLGIAATWQAVVGIEVLSVLIDGVLFFVPAKMGTQESGKILACIIFGLPPEKGLALGLIRRGRELFWDAAGLAIYALIRTTPPSRKEPVGAGTAAAA